MYVAAAEYFVSIWDLAECVTGSSIFHGQQRVHCKSACFVTGMADHGVPALVHVVLSSEWFYPGSYVPAGCRLLLVLLAAYLLRCIVTISWCCQGLCKCLLSNQCLQDVCGCCSPPWWLSVASVCAVVVHSSFLSVCCIVYQPGALWHWPGHVLSSVW